MNVKKLRKFFFFVMLLSMLLSGCEKGRKVEKDVAEFMQRAEKIAFEKKGVVEKKEKPIASYVYEGENLRDPFDRSERIIVTKRYADSILSNMSVDKLTLVGTVLKNDHSFAIVRGSDGKLYRLAKGVHVGVEQAMLVEIKQGEIVLKLESELGSDTKSNDIVMKVQE